MTRSEENTIKLFKDMGIQISKVPESHHVTPDYYIFHKGRSVFVEVKEVSENDEEKGIRKRVEECGESGIFSSSPVGDRFRTKIKEANKQLKKLCENGEHGIVVIQDVRPFGTQSVMPQEEIKQAMFGDRVIWKTIPSKQNQHAPEVTADIFSHNKTITEQKNTTISAVALLVEHSQTKKLALLIHHNPCARNPLPKSFFNGENIKEFRVKSTKDYSEFLEV